MNAGKSTALLQAAHNYESLGWNVILLVPAIDNRYGEAKITSRLGISRDATIVHTFGDVMNIVGNCSNSFVRNVILVDEVQFMPVQVIRALRYAVTKFKMPVIAYGLKNNFRGELFNETIAMLLAVADKLEETKQICWCGSKATQILKYDKNLNAVKSGDTVDLGAEDKYMSVCYEHWHNHTESTDYLKKETHDD